LHTLTHWKERRTIFVLIFLPSENCDENENEKRSANDLPPAGVDVAEGPAALPALLAIAPLLPASPLVVKVRHIHILSTP